MMKKRKLISLLLAAAMVMSLLAGCNPTGDADNSESPDSSASVNVVTTELEELGSGNVKWSEEKMADGWIKVTNDGGATLGYSPDSGVTLLQSDGFAFKDMNRNGALDPYEDWRQDLDTRAEDLAQQIPLETIFGLMNNYSLSRFESDGSDAYGFFGESFKEVFNTGVRSMLNYGSSNPVDVQAKWNNSAQAYVEGLDFAIPVNINVENTSLPGSHWIGNLAMAATFDPELQKEVSMIQAQQYRAVGATTTFCQIDLATEPRWSRITGTYGEDPALSRDMTEAKVSGTQSTFDEAGNDLGWGSDSVSTMMKHYPGDAPGEGGREAHNPTGKYNVYPGNAFATSLIPFLDGALSPNSEAGAAGAVMTSYSIAYTEDGSLGELVGSAYSEFKVGILREMCDYDGIICSDWGVTNGADAYQSACWGLEDITKEERMYLFVLAGMDQVGGDEAPPYQAAYDMIAEDYGEEAADTRFRESAFRIIKGYMKTQLFENPYVVVANATAQANSAEAAALAEESALKSIVMLKNEGNVISASTGERLTVYVPMQYNSGRWSLPIDEQAASEYFDIVTDTVGEPTGEPGRDGNPTHTATDITRASAQELANCDMAYVIVSSPSNAGSGVDAETGHYIPLSLQYGEYVANSSAVRKESLAGDMVATETMGTYGPVTTYEKENRSYYGEKADISNGTDLEGILYAADNMPEGTKIVVAINANNPMIFSEFEDRVDAILMGFGIDSNYFTQVVAGVVEPSGLLPMQMPANMETVEAQCEDVPRDMECHVDASGNTYDFGFGMNWSGVIQDARTARYCVPALTEPETVKLDF